MAALAKQLFVNLLLFKFVMFPFLLKSCKKNDNTNILELMHPVSNYEGLQLCIDNDECLGKRNM